MYGETSNEVFLFAFVWRFAGRWGQRPLRCYATFPVKIVGTDVSAVRCPQGKGVIYVECVNNPPEHCASTWFTF